MSVLQDLAVEAAYPRHALCQLDDGFMMANARAIYHLEDGRVYSEGGLWLLASGSRAEGLGLEDGWGHEHIDTDMMFLKGGRLGVYVPEGQRTRGQSCLTYSSEDCPPGHCKLLISDLNGLKKDWMCSRWYDDSCVCVSGGKQWLNTYSTVRRMKDSVKSISDHTVSGPAAQDDTHDRVHTLVCSGPHPDLDKEFRQRSRGEWPPISLLNCILQLPMLLVLVGHKLSPEFPLQARVSMSICEFKLIQALPESARQGYVASKYVLKHFLRAHQGEIETGSGRSHVGSYHMKTAFLYMLEKRPSILSISPFQVFLDLLCELKTYLELGTLPHYFLSQCDLLETVGDDERHKVCGIITEILSDPLHALLTSPTRPQEIYGKVHPDDLVLAFHSISDYSTCRQSLENHHHSGETDEANCSWLHQSHHCDYELFARMDERRLLNHGEQQKRDGVGQTASRRTVLIGLVDTLKQLKPCSVQYCTRL